MHVELWGKFQCSQLIHLLLQPSVLLRQILAASLQELTVNLRLLQLGPCPSVLKPHLHLSWSQVQLLSQGQLLLWIESVVFFEVFFENRGLILRESKLLSRSVAIFFVADSARTSSLHLMLVSVCFSLASFPAYAGNRAVW